jgi:uncharacterized protein YdeI (YjbR/CyaY-like superfamily)
VLANKIDAFHLIKPEGKTSNKTKLALGARQYLEWLTDAKTPETRDRRLATTLEWLTNGKSRHRKYANC